MLLYFLASIPVPLRCLVELNYHLNLAGYQDQVEYVKTLKKKEKENNLYEIHINLNIKRLSIDKCLLTVLIQ